MQPGETLGLVILGSDKTHLTVGQGDKECHAIYMSCGNIKKAIRTKIGARCWMMIAQVPLAKFEETKYQGVLEKRVLNQCLDVVLAGLKQSARTAVDIADPNGCIRKVRTFLLAYIADLPEQQALACVRTSYAPSSLAGPSSLGDSAAHALRYGEATLTAIQEIKDRLTEFGAEDDIGLFKKACEGYGLNGVEKPFWRDWLHADPSQFFPPEPLHQLFKFFLDHVLEWAISLLGNKEFDRRLSCLQPRLGMRHFEDGVTRFKQHTCKEARDILSVFLAIIAGHPKITTGIMKAMRAFVDFVYLTMYPSHSTVTLGYLEDALKKFHRNKRYIADAGVRNGSKQKGEFHIPKIELMQHVKRMIISLGSAPQFSSEQTERLHIDMAKEPYRHTNRRDFAEQMCRFLDREEKTRQFEALQEWASLGDWSTFDHAAKEKAFQKLAGKFLPTPVRDVFQGKSALCNETTAFQLRQKPNGKGLSLFEVQSQYRIPTFIEDLRRHFLGPSAHHSTIIPFSNLSTWWRVRVQLKDPQDTDVLLPPLTIQATPPMKIENIEHAGRYNFVLLRRDTADDLDGLANYGVRGMLSNIDFHTCFLPEYAYAGCIVAQLRIIFALEDNRSRNKLFAYVQPFKIASNAKAMVDPDIQMYRVVRDLRSDRTRKGLIVALSDIWRPVELIPRFGEKCNIEWNCNSAVELSKEFYLNCFMDGPSYMEIY